MVGGRRLVRKKPGTWITCLQQSLRKLQTTVYRRKAMSDKECLCISSFVIHHEDTKDTKCIFFLGYPLRLEVFIFVLFVSRQLLHELLYLLHPCSRSW